MSKGFLGFTVGGGVLQEQWFAGYEVPHRGAGVDPGMGDWRLTFANWPLAKEANRNWECEAHSLTLGGVNLTSFHVLESVLT